MDFQEKLYLCGIRKGKISRKIASSKEKGLIIFTEIPIDKILPMI